LVLVFAIVWALLPQSGPIEAVHPRFRVVSARITHSDWHELYFGGASGKMRDFLSNFLPITGPGGIRAGFPEKRTALTISYTGTLSAQELDSIQAFVVYPDGRTVMLRLHVFGSSTERKEFARVWEIADWSRERLVHSACSRDKCGGQRQGATRLKECMRW